MEFKTKNRVQIARFLCKLTQQQLADAIGVTRQTIGLIENEQYNPTIALCLRLAKALGVNVCDLFWLEEVSDEENH